MLRMVAPYLRMDNSVQTNNNQGKCLKTVIGYRISVYYIYIDSSLHFLCSAPGTPTGKSSLGVAQNEFSLVQTLLSLRTQPLPFPHCSELSHHSAQSEKAEKSNYDAVQQAFDSD